MLVGDTVIFGQYEQDNDLVNGPEPIERRVLLVEGDKAQIITKWTIRPAIYVSGNALSGSVVTRASASE